MKNKGLKTTDEKIKDAYNYAVNFYSNNHRGLDNQEKCLAEMQKISGFDRGTCIKIQNPVMDFFMMSELMEIGDTIAQQHLDIVTNNIRQHLLSINDRNFQPSPENQITNVVDTIKSSGGTVLGGISDSSRKKKGDVDVNYHLIKPIQRMLDTKVVGNEHLQGMVFRDCDLTGDDMDYIMNMPDWVDYNFKLIDFSNNLGINDLGINYALRGNCGHDDGVKYKGFLGRDRLHVVKLDLSNCTIGDKGAGYIAEALSDGNMASTKYVNLSGNKITENAEDVFINALKQPIVQDIIVILKRGYDLKTMVSGSKGDKQKIIKETLKNAQDNGVDVKNVAVSKGLGEFIWNNIKIGMNFSWGFVKCNIVPEDAKSFAGERIIAKISKKAFAAHTAKDAVVCFFDTIDEVSTSSEGVQLIKDLDLIGANALIDSIE